MQHKSEAYLMVHYKGAETKEQEQIYFAISKDGYCWESIKHGKPIIVCDKGEMGARDIFIIRKRDGEFVIMANDLCMSEKFYKKYNGQWSNIGRFGSPHISVWKSRDLVNWSEQQLKSIGDRNFGCFWGPEAIYDEEREKYVLYWSSAHASNDFGAKSIYYSLTDDFETFTTPKLFYKKDDASVVDPHIQKAGNYYYRFIKSRQNPFAVMMGKSKELLGPYEFIGAFNEWMSKYTAKEYEAPTLYQLPDGKWCLLLDYFGEEREYKGYVPFVAENLESGVFTEDTENFSFPYGMKHGMVISISREEYNRLKHIL